MSSTEDPPVHVHFHDEPEAWVGFGTDTRDGVAHVRGVLEEVDGRVVLTRLEFVANKPEERGGLTSSTLRSLRLDAVVGKARGRLSQFDPARAKQGFPDPGAKASVDPDVVAQLERFFERIGKLARAAAEQKAGGRRGYGDDFYRLVALEYVALSEQGNGGRGALQRLAAVMATRLGEKQPRSRDNIRDWVAEARRRGFLTPGEPGRGGGGPGPRLYADVEWS